MFKSFREFYKVYGAYHPFFKNSIYSKLKVDNGKVYDGIVYRNYIDGNYYLKNILPKDYNDIFIRKEIAEINDLFNVDIESEIPPDAPIPIDTLTRLRIIQR
jgi:hypothetical protein